MSDDGRRDVQPGSDDGEALIVAYALGGVTGAEAERACDLIVRDTAYATLYDDLRAIAAVLPALYADTLDPDDMPAPSAGLKARVIAAARADAHGEGTDAPPADPPAPVPLAAVRERRAPWYAGWLAAAALLIAVVGLGAWNLNLRSDVQQANRDRDVVRLAAAGTHAYAMAGTRSAPDANATLIESGADGGRIIFLAKGFPTTATGQTYRVWLQLQDGSFAEAGTFDGGVPITLILPGNLSGIHAVTITAEPTVAPASKPTGVPVMEGTLV